MLREVFVGLDIETSGTEVGVHQLLQIGAKYAEHAYDATVGWDHIVVDPHAMEVNKIPITSVMLPPGHPGHEGGARRADIVDAEFAAWCAELAGGHYIVPVGWNVGSFDMPFIRATFPESAKSFSYRSVDLNSVCFSLWGKKYRGAVPTWKHWKRMAKQAAQDQLTDEGHLPQWHDALYDARAAIAAWQWLCDRIWQQEA